MSRKLYADSTIAMTAYNVIAMHPQPMTADAILRTAAGMQHAHLSLEQLTRSLARLVEYKRIRVLQSDPELYELVAKERLMVVQRDLSDYDPGTMEGGWEGWQCKDPRVRDGIGTRSIEALVGLPPTNRRPKPFNAGVSR